MGKVLYIKANAKPQGVSRTFKISDSFIETYKENHPNDEIITLDLYKENINPLTETDINSVFGTKTEESKNHPVLKYAYQFAEVDKYVVAAPMWNLSIPAVLKAYIDYICVTGITFKYTANGPVGLCKNKKALYIVTRGGEYSAQGAAYEMGERYLKTIFSFLGVSEFSVVAAEKLDVVGEDVNTIVGSAITKANDMAKNF